MPTLKNLNPPKTYDLVFISGGIVKETVMTNVQKPLALWKRLQVKHLYTNGILVVQENVTKTTC